MKNQAKNTDSKLYKEIFFILSRRGTRLNSILTSSTLGSMAFSEERGEKEEEEVVAAVVKRRCRREESARADTGELFTGQFTVQGGRQRGKGIVQSSRCLSYLIILEFPSSSSEIGESLFRRGSMLIDVWEENEADALEKIHKYLRDLKRHVHTSWIRE